MSDVDDGGHLADPLVSGSAGVGSESGSGRPAEAGPFPVGRAWTVRPGERLSTFEDRQLGLYEPLDAAQYELMTTDELLALGRATGLVRPT